MANILIIQLARIGDLLQSSPLIQGVRAKFPCASLTLLTGQQNTELARGIPGIDEVLGLSFSRASEIMDEKANLTRKYNQFSDLLDGIRGRYFDSVYNLNHSPMTVALMNLIRFSEVLCYGVDRTGREIVKSPWLSYLFSALGDRRLNRFNLVDIYLHAAGLSPPKNSCFFKIEKEDEIFVDNFLIRKGIRVQDEVIGFQVGAGDPVRRWPLQSYAELGGLLLQQSNVTLLLFGGVSEVELGAQLQSSLGRTKERFGRVVNLVGETTFRQLAAFLGRCDLLVTPDTGTMHLAAAVGTRVLALFMGSAFCHETGPYGCDHWVLYPDLECYPCFQNRPSCTDYACKKEISPERVARIVLQIFRQDQKVSMGNDHNPMDSKVRLLRSRMGKGFVECIPSGESSLSTEEAFSLAYRTVWQGILDDDWDPTPFDTENVLGNYPLPPPTKDIGRKIKDMEGDFERLERILNTCRENAGRRESVQEVDRFLNLLRQEETASRRWVRPLLIFLQAEYRNLHLRGADRGVEGQRLLEKISRGAGFMKAFSSTLSDFCLSKV